MRVVVRVRDGDGRDAAQPLDHPTPRRRAGRCSPRARSARLRLGRSQERPLADGELRLRADADQARPRPGSRCGGARAARSSVVHRWPASRRTAARPDRRAGAAAPRSRRTASRRSRRWDAWSPALPPHRAASSTAPPRLLRSNSGDPDGPGSGHRCRCLRSGPRRVKDRIGPNGPAERAPPRCGANAILTHCSDRMTRPETAVGGTGMKIELGEFLILSWLRHVRGCVATQMNWSPSPAWTIARERELCGRPSKRFERSRMTRSTFGFYLFLSSATPGSMCWGSGWIAAIPGASRRSPWIRLSTTPSCRTGMPRRRSSG